MSTEPRKRTHYVRLLSVNGGSSYLYFTSEVAGQSVIAALKEAKRNGGGAVEIFHVTADGEPKDAHSVLDAGPVFMATLEAFGA